MCSAKNSANPVDLLLDFFEGPTQRVNMFVAIILAFIKSCELCYDLIIFGVTLVSNRFRLQFLQSHCGAADK